MTVDVDNLPTYSFKEEVMNSITHFIGFLFACGTLIFFIVFQALNNISFHYMAPFYFYSLVMTMIFLVSSLYHSSKFGSKKRAVTRMIDHCDIYVFVFATYLPICMRAVTNNAASISMIVIEIALTVIGITLNLIPKDCKATRLITYLIYLIEGWLIIAFYPFGVGIPFNVFIFVLLGGIVYTMGAITYAIGSKRKWFHSIFHIFVVIAAILQFVGIMFILL